MSTIGRKAQTDWNDAADDAAHARQRVRGRGLLKLRGA